MKKSMDYISILPKDLKNLLNHYTNHHYWKVMSEIYRRFLQISSFDDKDAEDGKRALLETLGLKYSMDIRSVTHNGADELTHKYSTSKPELDIDQLVTVIDVQKLFNILIVNDFGDDLFVDYMLKEINLLLREYQCPLFLLKIELSDGCSTTIGAKRWFVVNSQICDFNILMNNIGNALTL